MNTNTKKKTYFATSGMRTNLDSLNTKLYLVECGMRGDNDCSSYVNEDKSFDFLDVHYTDEYDIYLLREEVQNLLWKGQMGTLSGKEYGRAKELSDARDMMRYATCLANGMSEQEASLAFMG